MKHLNNGTPVLIEGPSMSGKTRLALETIRSHWPEAPFWFPRDDGDIEQLLSSSQQPAPHTVILLDDLDRFLSNQSLTLGLLNQWTNNSCIIIATMMHSQYVKHSDRANEKVSGWDTVNRFKTITLNPSLSTEELNAIKHTSYANQLSQIESIGLGPLLGCAEAVRTAFTDELDEHSWCGALIKAAADWRRIGLGFATKSQLITLSATHGNNVWDETDWDDTWRRATTPIKNATPLLRQVGIDEWEVIDIIADEAFWPLSNEFLTSASSLNLSEPQKFILALEMCSNSATRTRAEKLLKTIVSNNPKNTWAAIAYANLLNNIHNNIDQAELLYKSAVQNDPKCAFALRIYADFLANFRNNSAQAEILFQQAIEADPEDSSNLGAYAEFLADFR
ncbi:tetratricopeptide repeat protein, partial [Actinomyces naeslundii]|uniref:tetratricopeptide repeat protein n=1 Tax=Actinomyces naeslundii TaxID=1655 RepID=UPI001956C3E5